MSRTLRLSLVALGLAAVVYGTASLTGGWLGMPPWWERAAPITPYEWLYRYDFNYSLNWGISIGFYPVDVPEHFARAEREAPLHIEPREGREWISGAVVVAGITLVGIGAWPRRRRERVS